MESQLLIACDFDGTVTRQDTLVEILDRYGSSSWRTIQDRVVSGELSIRQGLQAEMESVQADIEQLRDLLATRIEMDSTFPGFLERMRTEGIPVVLLTGGFDFCVETVLKRFGVWPMPILANRLIYKGTVPEGDTPRHGVSPFGLFPTWEVEFPFPSLRCQACGHCKGDPLREWSRQGYTTLFAGNGVTDQCAAETASVTFAKEELESWCRRQGIPAMGFRNFNDIQTEMEKRKWL